MTPSEALTLRVQTLEGWLRNSARHTTRLDTLPYLTKMMGSAERTLLAQAHLYTWRSDLLKASLSAAESLPSPVTVTSALLPSSDGLYLFDEPFIATGVVGLVAGIGWIDFGGEFIAILVYSPTKGTGKESWGPITSVASFLLKYGVDVETETIKDMRVMPESVKTCDAPTGSRSIVRFLLSSWLWVKQRVMVTESVVASGASRKQAERAHVVTGVNIVVLRRSEGSDRTADSSGRDWSCQWLVRGHWRNQFYRSTSTHEPKWIEPYVKGPDDKPFRAPTETVFTVNR